jgi:diguanylate cyclase (GGDEF)-like protein
VERTLQKPPAGIALRAVTVIIPRTGRTGATHLAPFSRQTADNSSMHRILINNLKDAWSTTSFATEDVALFAQKLTIDEVRKGLMGMSLILLCLFGVESQLFTHTGLDASAGTTCLLLAALAIHIMVSARAINDVRSLYLLGTTLLMISGTAFVLLAHNSGSFSFPLFASVTLLFMVVPLVPWGLKEAMLVLSLIYGTFTFSTWGAHQHFDNQTLWSLQFIMLGAGIISMALVVRNTSVRKTDIRTRYELEQANRRMMHLSNKDPLTGAWNRRFLKNVFAKKSAEWHAAGKMYHFAFLDLDDFKPMNDNCGHNFGDEVLRCVSQMFSQAVQEDGFLIRMGGDEFALLFINDDPETLIASTLEAIQQAIKPPGQCQKIRIGVSAGIASIPPGNTQSQEDIYHAADTALYTAKACKGLVTNRANIVRQILDTDKDRQISVA